MTHQRPYLHRAFLVTIAAVMPLLFAVATSANSTGPPNAFTNAPLAGGGNEATCVVCHAAFGLDSGPGVLEIVGPMAYVPDEVYEIVVMLDQTGQSRWGFEMTAVDDEFLDGVGTFISPDGDTQVGSTATREYIKHTSAGTFDNQLDSSTWSFDWQAPNADIGPISFYATGNAANSNNGTSGDYIYTATITVPEPSSNIQIVAALSMFFVLHRFRNRNSGRPRTRRRSPRSIRST